MTCRAPSGTLSWPRACRGAAWWRPTGPAGPLTWIFVQFGLGRLPLGSSGLGSGLPPPQLLLEALVKIPKFAGSHHSRVALGRFGEKGSTVAKLGSKGGCNRTRYHLVHRVVGVVALGVRAADPRRFQQLVLLFLLVGLLLLSVVLRTRLLGLSTPDGEAAPLRKGLLWISVPGRDVTSLSAQTGRALGPAVSLLLPAAPLPVSTRGSTEESGRRLGPPPPPHNTPDADPTG